MIYISFGMTKSASTFLYQLTEETFRAAGRRPARLRPPFRPLASAENYFDDIDPELIDAIARAVNGRDVVLKTHQGLHPGVASRIEAGGLLANVSVRDPREIALSMVDHGRKSARLGLPEFTECRTVRNAWPSLDNQVENLKRWSALKAVEVFLYNEICFETVAVVKRIAAQIGVEIDVKKALRPFRSKRLIGQFNKGAALRYREMPISEQAAFLDRYRNVYETFRFDTPAALEAARFQEGRPPQPRSGLGDRLSHFERTLRS
jgi:hypothetical protein